jgi:predicted transglutaminase-like cysteine proteinase
MAAMTRMKKSNRTEKRALGKLSAAVLFSLIFSISTSAEELTVDPTIVQEIPIVSMIDQQAPQKSWFQRWFGKPTMDEVIQTCSTPKELSRMVSTHIAYREESADVWATADETWNRSFGDCEDFAICLQQLCKERELDAKVYVFFSSKFNLEGHAVTIGNWNGHTWMSSLGSYEEFESMDKINDKVADIIGCSAKDLWSFSIDQADIDRFITLKNAPQSPEASFSTAMNEP